MENESPIIYSFYVENNLRHTIDSILFDLKNWFYQKFSRKCIQRKIFNSDKDSMEIKYQQETWKKIKISVKVINDDFFPLEVDAIIDTGSECCSISPYLAQCLQLTPFMEDTIQGVTGAKVTNVYKCGLSFSNSVNFSGVPFYESDVLGTKERGHIIIGMNILSKTVFSYDSDEKGNKFFSIRFKK